MSAAAVFKQRKHLRRLSMPVHLSIFIVLALGSCGVSSDAVYTLYRNSATAGGQLMRIHVATFDAKGRETYNHGNCEIARELFQGQPGVTVKFWCEKGRFRK
jgi:hypothetical protein